MELIDRFKNNSYVNTEGYTVLTEKFHIDRGRCCGNECLHCPYTKPTKRGNIKLRSDIKILIGKLENTK